MTNLTTISLDDLSRVTGGAGESDGPSLGAAPMLGGAGNPVSPMMQQGVGNMGFGATKSFGSVGGFNAPGVGNTGPASGLGGGGGGKPNPFKAERDILFQ
jgi:hypothetical protein